MVLVVPSLRVTSIGTRLIVKCSLPSAAVLSWETTRTVPPSTV